MEVKENKALAAELRELASFERRVCKENGFAPAYADVMERAAAMIENLQRGNKRLAARIINGIIDSDFAKNYDGSALEEADKHNEMLEGELERLNRENLGQSDLICSLRDDLRRVTRERDMMKAERDALLADVKGSCKCCGNADTAFCWLCRKGKHWKWRGVQKEEG